MLAVRKDRNKKKRLFSSSSLSPTDFRLAVQERLITEQKHYELVVNRMIAAIDTGDTRQAQIIDDTEVDPVYGSAGA